MLDNIVISGGFLVCSILFMIKAQIYISKKDTKIPLFDHLHKNMNYIKFYNISDYFIYCYILSLFYFNFHICKFLNLLSLIYLIRTFSFTITILPKCGKIKDKTETNSFKILYNYLSLKDRHSGYNNDLLFSGHTSFMHLYYLYLTYFKYISNTNSIILFTINFLLSLLNIVSRCHYSIDILYAYITTTFIFQNLINIV